jgi:hypothetical protein
MGLQECLFKESPLPIL